MHRPRFEMTARSSAALVAFLIFAAGGTTHVGSSAAADRDVVKEMGERDGARTLVGADSHEPDDSHDGRLAAAATHSF